MNGTHSTQPVAQTQQRDRDMKCEEIQSLLVAKVIHHLLFQGRAKLCHCCCSLAVFNLDVPAVM